MKSKKICFFILIALTVSFLLTGCFSDGLNADTWYTYNDLDSLKVQNCTVSNAVAMSSGMVTVSYLPVCRGCHTSAKQLEMGTVSSDYPLNNTYYCDKCGETTTVRLQISY